MHWLYLVLSVVLLLMAMKATLPGWLVFLMLLGSLVAAIAWIMGWLALRISSGARSEMQILSPDELRQLREQAEARKAAAAAERGDPPA